jgi:hypothetical protein
MLKTSCKVGKHRKGNNPPTLRQTEVKTNSAYTAHAVHSAGGAREEPPRESQKDTRGNRQVSFL